MSKSKPRKIGAPITEWLKEPLSTPTTLTWLTLTGVLTATLTLGMTSAPPRTLDGFVDTLAGTKLSLDHPLLVRFYNPIAAMPSHHVAFAWVTGLGLAARATRRRGKLAWYAYPGLVGLTVIATANHFVADVAGGAALGALARRLAR